MHSVSFHFQDSKVF